MSFKVLIFSLFLSPKKCSFSYSSLLPAIHRTIIHIYFPGVSALVSCTYLLFARQSSESSPQLPSSRLSWLVFHTCKRRLSYAKLTFSFQGQRLPLASGSATAIVSCNNSSRLGQVDKIILKIITANKILLFTKPVIFKLVKLQYRSHPSIFFPNVFSSFSLTFLFSDIKFYVKCLPSVTLTCDFSSSFLFILILCYYFAHYHSPNLCLSLFCTVSVSFITLSLFLLCLLFSVYISRNDSSKINKGCCNYYMVCTYKNTLRW